ncbi:hypothetical protein Q3189_01105 [Clostridioides difficile]
MIIVIFWIQFTFHIVNIKQLLQKYNPNWQNSFTFHIVNIKLEKNDRDKTEDVKNLHSI